MPEDTLASRRLEQARQIFRELEAEPKEYDPELARIYAGQWVVIYRGQVISHGKSGSELVDKGQLQKFPSARLEYVPTLEQQEGVWLLPLAAADV